MHHGLVMAFLFWFFGILIGSMHYYNYQSPWRALITGLCAGFFVSGLYVIQLVVELKKRGMW